MMRVLRWTASLLLLFTLAVIGVVGLMRIQPLRLLDIDSLAQHNDGNLRLGDFIVVMGAPMGMDTNDGEHAPSYAVPFNIGAMLLDIRWRTLELDVSTDDFGSLGPYSHVLYVNPSEWSDTPRWRGFIQP